MTVPSGQRVLAVNTGSSSLKAALYRMGSTEILVAALEIDRIGHAGGHLRISDGSGAAWHDGPAEYADHAAALRAAFAWLDQHGFLKAVQGVGHRMVHGGTEYGAPCRVDEQLLGALRELVPLAADHLPQAIGAIEYVARHFPALPQVACFDTAFHRSMPAPAQAYALPRHFHAEGLRRFGFHGLSYEYVTARLRELGGGTAPARSIIAHLGSGASMAAIRDGAGIDTSMGLSPASGLMMATRAGDLDAEAILYLVGQRSMTPEAVDDLINRQGGLLGVSGTSSDVRELLDSEAGDPRAAEALGMFCYRARKYLGAYAAALGGLDALVFTGGIGTHAAPIRARICTGLEFLGIHVDPALNAAHASVISPVAGPVTVHVMKTNEELVIARNSAALLR